MRAGFVVIACVALSALPSLGCHMGLAGLVMGASDAQPAYQSGAIAAELGSGAVRTLGCLDVGLAIPEQRALLEMHVGNRCVHGEPFDLGRVVIRATDEEGGARAVSFVDPRQEIVRLHVGAMERGHERIRLDGLLDVARICFDLAAAAPDAPDARPPPICLDRSLDGWRAGSAP